MYMCSYIMLRTDSMKALRTDSMKALRTDSMKAIHLLILLIHTCSLYAKS